MRPIYQDMKKCEADYKRQWGISEDILMDRAGYALFDEIRRSVKQEQKIIVVAGPGNNGGDGSVLAFYLKMHRWRVFLYYPFDLRTNLSKINRKKCEALGVPILSSFEDTDVCVDCLFGVGFKKERYNAECAVLIREMNEKSQVMIACDVPTALGEKEGIWADITVSLLADKWELMKSSVKDQVGDMKIHTLGLDPTLCQEKPVAYLLELSDHRPPIRSQKNVHKGHFGHVVCVQGEKRGAAMMAARSALRYGAGLVTCLGKCYGKDDEVMFSEKWPDKARVCAVGMGLGKKDLRFLLKDLEDKEISFVLDADILYSPQFIDIIERGYPVVLTPHIKEAYEHLKVWGDQETSSEEFSLVERMREKSKFYPHVTWVLKGANMFIIQNDICYVSRDGGAQLSQAGSGDILVGLIASLLAQKLSPLEAAKQGVLTLIKASYQAMKRRENYAVVAGDIIDSLGYKEKVL